MEAAQERLRLSEPRIETSVDALEACGNAVHILVRISSPAIRAAGKARSDARFSDCPGKAIALPIHTDVLSKAIKVERLPSVHDSLFSTLDVLQGHSRSRLYQ